jgi:putative transposase
MLGINRSSLYYKPVQPSSEEVGIKHRIDEIYTKHPFYGSRRIAVELAKVGLIVNRKAVQRHMREMGIIAIYPGPNLSKRALQHKIFPYLLRNVAAARSNHIWGIDITYIRMPMGWLYLVAVIDWFSRYIVSWELDDTLEMSFVLAAVDRALKNGKPDIWNSDQGSHFTSDAYIQRLQDNKISISMDGKGRAIDNIFTERFWRSLKYEEVYLHAYTSPREARSGIGRYIDFYNLERPHQSLDYQAPASLYFPA